MLCGKPHNTKIFSSKHGAFLFLTLVPTHKANKQRTANSIAYYQSGVTLLASAAMFSVIPFMQLTALTVALSSSTVLSLEVKPITSVLLPGHSSRERQERTDCVRYYLTVSQSFLPSPPACRTYTPLWLSSVP